MSGMRPYCVGPSGGPIVIPTGGNLYEQASLISSCFKNPVIDCDTVGIDGTQNFCFDVTPPGGGTPQWIAVSLQSVNGIVNPNVALTSVASAKSRGATNADNNDSTDCSGGECQYLANQTAPCGPTYGSDCANDTSCSNPVHPGCSGCCNNPFGVIFQQNATTTQIQACLTNPTSGFCLPCPPGTIPITRPPGNDSDTLTYYTCTSEFATVNLTCNAQDKGTMDYSVTNAFNIVNYSGSLVTSGGTSTIPVTMSTGDTLSISNLTAQVPTNQQPMCIINSGAGPYEKDNAQTVTFPDFTYTFTNLSGIIASIVFEGTPCKVLLECDDSDSKIACAGTLAVQVSGFSGIPSLGTATIQSQSNCSKNKCAWSSGAPMSLSSNRQ